MPHMIKWQDIVTASSTLLDLFYNNLAEIIQHEQEIRNVSHLPIHHRTQP